MFKKLNQYFLVNHPLLWNLKLHIILPFGILLHIIFFLLAYSNYNSIRDFYDGKDYDFFKEWSFGIYSFFIIAISIIIWLLYYLRNNAFKSFYPVKKSYLVKEFLLLCVILFITFSNMGSYKLGKNLKFSQLTKNFDVKKDAEKIAQAKCFLVFEQNEFEKQNCCDSLRVRDSINASIEPQIPNDSCFSEIYNNGEYSQVEETTSIARENYDSSIDSATSYFTPTYSYLYYCSQSNTLFYDILTNSLIYSQNAKRWILNNKKDSIKNATITYLEVLKKYEGNYSFDIDKLLNDINADEKTFNEIMKFSTYDYDYNSRFVKTYSTNDKRVQPFIENTYLLEMINKIKVSRETFFVFDTYWNIYLYLALGFSAFLAMFRFTRLKNWLISIISFGIFCITIPLFDQFVKTDITATILVFIFIAITFVLSFVLIKSRKKKMLSAVFLHWFMFSISFAIPLAFNLIEKFTREQTECIKNILTVVKKQQPINFWINDNSETITYINIIFVLLIFIFYTIPMCYKWQSNPNE